MTLLLQTMIRIKMIRIKMIRIKIIITMELFKFILKKSVHVGLVNAVV